MSSQINDKRIEFERNIEKWHKDLDKIKLGVKNKRISTKDAKHLLNRLENRIKIQVNDAKRINYIINIRKNGGKNDYRKINNA